MHDYIHTRLCHTHTGTYLRSRILLRCNQIGGLRQFPSNHCRIQFVYVTVSFSYGITYMYEYSAVALKFFPIDCLFNSSVHFNVTCSDGQTANNVSIRTGFKQPIGLRL